MAASVGATAVLPSAPGNLLRGIVNCFFFQKKSIQEVIFGKTAISKHFVCNKLCGTSEFIEKTFQAAQLTHERFLTMITGL